jgi:hypothetical protein
MAFAHTHSADASHTVCVAPDWTTKERTIVMKRNVLITGLIIAAAAGFYACVARAGAPGPNDKSLLRIGVYDSRAVTIAYCASPHNPNIMVKKSKAKHKAEQAGDLEKAEKIDRWMFYFAVKRHSQGFATAPVGDLLKPIDKKLPKIARTAGVDIIVSKWQLDYIAPDAKVVDITTQIVAAYKPTEKTLTTIKQIKEIKPITESEIVKHELEGGH